MEEKDQEDVPYERGQSVEALRRSHAEWEAGQAKPIAEAFAAIREELKRFE